MKKFDKLSRPQGKIKDVYCDKSAILNLFSVIVELVQELDIINMQNKFEQDTWKTFEVIALIRKY